MDKEARTWLITGADKGLGAAAARVALAQGDNVVVTVLAKDGDHGLAAEFPDRLRSLHLDARDIHRTADAVARALSFFDRIDVLVNNAGYGVAAPAEETPADTYRALFEVGFFSLVEMTRAVLAIMRRQRAGHIINLSSIAGFSAYPGFAFYSAVKFAVEGYSEALSKEVAPFGVKVTIVEPGAFRTDFRGPSLVSAINPASDYADLNRALAGVSQASGQQPNDPEKFGAVLCKIVAQEKPPLRLPLGEDAVEARRGTLAAVGDELQAWLDLSRSTTFAN
ncbi:Short-chain dehydrogenase [Paracoccus pantotrophus]|nr:Short-chain dehydrogenase [Paracoccus pantotrophus]